MLAATLNKVEGFRKAGWCETCGKWKADLHKRVFNYTFIFFFPACRSIYFLFFQAIIKNMDLYDGREV
jgi:hypothetical protein